MYEIKVTPDSGARYKVAVERDELAVIVAEIVRRVALGQVSSFTVHTVYEKVAV